MFDISDFKTKLKESSGFLSAELAKIRSGRATPALVEDVLVDYYGAKTALKGLASIGAPDARTLVIEPWDKNAVEAIAKALVQSSLGSQPVVDGTIIRFNLPPLTQERRLELIKLVAQKVEEARVKSRRLRDDAIKSLQLLEKEGRISEDGKFRQKEEIEKAMKEHGEELEEMRRKKEQELTS
ncbi:MAG: ribosome recycling factor [Parcubacteria group bacterium]|nr:ribosome recycling factor [Parcubacteria group bacterium]